MCVWPPCCDVFRHVACCWLKFENDQIWANNSQHVATRRNRVAKRTQYVAPNNIAICCDMLSWHVVIVWPGLKVLWLFIIPFGSKAFIKPNKIYFTHNKENSIRNTVTLSVHQCFKSFWPFNITGCVIQHLAGRKFGGLRLQLRDSTFGREDVWRSASGDRHDRKKTNKKIWRS